MKFISLYVGPTKQFAIVYMNTVLKKSQKNLLSLEVTQLITMAVELICMSE